MSYVSVDNHSWALQDIQQQFRKKGIKSMVLSSHPQISIHLGALWMEKGDFKSLITVCAK